MIPPLLMILVCLIVAYMLGEAFRQVGLPRIVGQILAGMVLSIGTLKVYLFSAQNVEVLSFLANLGIILLFYYIGLETNFLAFTQNMRKSFLISVFNTSIPFLLGFFLMKGVLGASSLVGVIVGISLSVSAQAVSVDLLEELKLLKSKIGSLIVTAGAVDDVVEMIMISVLLSTLHIAVSSFTIDKLLLDIGFFLLLMVLAKLWLVPFALKFFDREKSSTARFTGAMVIVLLIASLADFLSIGAMIGAMAAGIIIRQTIFRDIALPKWEEHDISRSVHIIAFGFLIPLFSVWVGSNIDISSIMKNAGLIVVLTLIATIGTVLGTMVAVWLDRGSWWEGFVLGWGLSPKGDVELVIASLALRAGILSGGLFTALVMMSLLTTVISPIVFKQLVVRYRGRAL